MLTLKIIIIAQAAFGHAPAVRERAENVRNVRKSIVEIPMKQELAKSGTLILLALFYKRNSCQHLI